MSTREKYFAAKVAAMIADAKAVPDVVTGPIRYSIISQPTVRPDVGGVGDPITGFIKSN